MASRVLLVNSNRIKPAIAPIGLEYLAQALWSAGHHVSLLDLCLSDDPRSVEQALCDEKPDVIGVTIRNTDDCYFASSTSFVQDVQSLVARLRSQSEAPIVLGGVGFSIMPEPILRRCGVSLGVAGDGEAAFPELVARLERGERFDDLPGLVWRTDERVVHNGPAIADISSTVRSRSFLDNARYFQEGGQAGLETKRGCGAACVYCADPVAKGRAVRLRHPARVADEAAALLSQGVDHLHMCDPEFNLPYDHAVAVCRELIARGLGDKLRWYTYAAPAPFSAELADLMRRAGCVGIDFGADSAVDEMLRGLGRSHSLHELEKTVRFCRQAGLIVMLDLLVGGPGESPDTVARTIEAMRRLEPDVVGVAVGVRIYPGTALARRVERDGFSATNPHLRGRIEGNDDMLEPVFYVSAELGDDPLALVDELVGGDPRFFTGERDSGDASYNYNDNSVLVQAIRRGYRGAYWHVLRQLADEQAAKPA